MNEEAKRGKRGEKEGEFENEENQGLHLGTISFKVSINSQVEDIKQAGESGLRDGGVKSEVFSIRVAFRAL